MALRHLAELRGPLYACSICPSPVTTGKLQVPFMGVLAGGVVGIGASYGVTLTKDEGWKLVKEFFKAAGFTYAATIVRGKLISFAVAVTGIGYPGAVALRTVPLAGLTGERVRHPYQTD